MSTPNFVLFIVSAALAVFGAVGTVAARKPLRGAVWLLVMIVALAGLFLTLHAQLLSALQLLVYAGAVVVLFVFVIMLIGPASEVPRTPRGMATRAFGAMFMVMITMTLTSAALHVVVPAAGLAPDYGTVEGLGTQLYRMTAVPFELVSITLLVAIIGAIAVARGRTKEEAAAIKRRLAARDAEDAARSADERRLAAEVAAHGGH